MSQEDRALRRLITALLSAAVWLPMGSHAGEAGGSMSATTNYVYRGLSQTLGNSALQGDLHYVMDNRSVIGVWVSNVDLYPDADDLTMEIDLYAGREWNLSRDWDIRLGYGHYMYPGDKSRVRYDYDEVTATLTWLARFSATIAWSPNVSRYVNYHTAKSEAATSYEFSASQPLGQHFSLVAGIGYYDLPEVLRADYAFRNGGLTIARGKAQLVFMYIDTDQRAVRSFGPSVAANGWTGSLSWRF